MVSNVEKSATSKHLTQREAKPDHILQVGLGFWASKTLLSATKLGLFTFLGTDKRKGEEIAEALGLHPLHLYDFLDALTSLGFLERKGKGAEAVYANTPDTETFLMKGKPTYIGGFLEMANDREYKYWGDLEEGLKTGLPQNEVKYTGKESFEAIYHSSEALRSFTEAMSSIQVGNFMALAQKYDFERYSTVTDIGGSGGVLSAILAKQHPHLRCTTYDLPMLTPLVKETVEKYGVEDRVRIAEGNFFIEKEFPKADVYTMGNILHSFSMKNKKRLIRKAYEGLPEGGALIVIETIMDNDRSENTFALLMSLNMLIESDGGFNYSFDDFEGWVKEEGFRHVESMHLAGPVSAAIAYK